MRAIEFKAISALCNFECIQNCVPYFILGLRYIWSVCHSKVNIV